MPEYECAVTHVHKRSYKLPQAPPPVCCGKPMVLPQSSAQVAAPAAAGPEALWTHEMSTVPQKEKKWWELWK